MSDSDERVPGPLPAASGKASLAIALLFAPHAYYNLTSGGLRTFDALPFSPRQQDFSVEAVNANGKIAVRTLDGLVAVEPGKNIQQQSVSQWNGLCRIRTTTTLTNHGFLSDAQVVLR